MTTNEFDILSMQLTSAQNEVYNTPNVLIDEGADLEKAVYEIYQKLTDEVKGQNGSLRLCITHHTQKARELVLSGDLLRFLAENEIGLGVE